MNKNNSRNDSIGLMVRARELQSAEILRGLRSALTFVSSARFHPFPGRRIHRAPTGFGTARA